MSSKKAKAQNGKIKDEGSKTNENEEAEDKPKPLPVYFKADDYERSSRTFSEQFDYDAAKHLELSARDKEVIRETFADMQTHLIESGTKVFIQIFKISSNIRSVFPFAEELDDLDELVHNEHLIKHSTQFMQAVSFAVQRMDHMHDDDAGGIGVGTIFINLGRKHIYFKKLKEDYFDIFAGALMWVWKQDLGEKLTPEVRSAWKKLFDFILAHLKFGYLMAIKEKNSGKK